MILPVTDDRDSGPFFAAAREGRLVYRACTACDHGIHPPTPFCNLCGGDGEWREASGRGVARAATVVTHQIHPDYPVPYTVVVVELEENAAVRLLGHLPGHVEIAWGAPMRVEFRAVAEDVVLPDWRPA
jgi:uncharacterized OB-fold protein